MNSSTANQHLHITNSSTSNRTITSSSTYTSPSAASATEPSRHPAPTHHHQQHQQQNHHVIQHLHITNSNRTITTNFLFPFVSLISLVHLSAPLCPQAPTLNLLSTCLMVCSILDSRPISFPSLFLLSSPSPTD